jgi:hypothetical protein
MVGEISNGRPDATQIAFFRGDDSKTAMQPASRPSPLLRPQQGSG